MATRGEGGGRATMAPPPSNTARPSTDGGSVGCAGRRTSVALALPVKRLLWTQWSCSDIDTDIDTGIDASIDIGIDTGIDTNIDTSIDIGIDASIDTSNGNYSDTAFKVVSEEFPHRK